MYSLIGISSSLSLPQVSKEDIRYNSYKRLCSNLSWKVRMAQALLKSRQMYSSVLQFLVPLEIFLWKKQKNNYSISQFFQATIKQLLELKEWSKLSLLVNKKMRKILRAKVVVKVLRMMKMISLCKRQMGRKGKKDRLVPSLRKRELEESKNMMG